MASTKPLTTNDESAEDFQSSDLGSRGAPPWREAGLPYYSCNYYLRRRFGRRVQKVSIDAGFTCPNVDGTVATGGCTFCDNRSFSPSRRLPRAGIRGQIDQSIARMRLRYRKCRDYLAYFQPATNTYAPVERLRAVYEEALAHPQVVGLVIGTRPDCVPNEVLDLIEEFATRQITVAGVCDPGYVSDDQALDRDVSRVGLTEAGYSGGPASQRPATTGAYVSVEYGMQTIHDRSLDWMNRGHHHDAMLDAARRSRGRGFEIGAHIMLGLPGETHDDMLATAREVARLNLDAVKIHNLYCVKNTPLADQVARGEVRLMERAEYVSTLVDFIELLPPTMIVNRISGDAPPDYFIGPTWCLDKPAIKNAVMAEFEQRKTWQGRKWNSAQ